MAVMAWPRGAALPTIPPMIFFLLATAWFVAAAVIEPHHWLGNMYHSAMMLAMSPAWMGTGSKPPEAFDLSQKPDVLHDWEPLVTVLIH